VQLLVFEDGAHAAPTLFHTRTAKFEYRAISQFAAWALAKAQGIESSGTGFPVDTLFFTQIPSSLVNHEKSRRAEK
jgi:hypothetical protein